MATTQTRIGPADYGRRMSLDEFREADEEPGYLYELAQGVLEVVEIPGRRHWRIIDNIHELLGDYRRRYPGLIDMIGRGSDVRFRIPSRESDRHPDLGVALVGDPTDDKGRPRPGLVVEVVSQGKAARDRDYVAKVEDYLAVGVREYWIVDPELEQVTVLVRREVPGGPTWHERVYRGEEMIGSEILPGYAVTVAQLWVDARGA